MIKTRTIKVKSIKSEKIIIMAIAMIKNYVSSNQNWYWESKIGNHIII